MSNILLEVLQPRQDKKAVVVIGRFSPPHLGHYKAINAAKAFIRKNPELKLEAQPIVIVIAGEKTSLDKTKNPLSAEDRIKFMAASDNANGVIFNIATNAFSAFEKVRELGYEPIALAAGSDRAEHYLEMLDKNFLNDNGTKIKHYIVPNLERTSKELSDTKDGEIDVKNVSGTMVRAAVQANYLDVFTKLVGMEKMPKLAQLMFNKIKKAMVE